eukprot:g28221.t1
MSIVTITKEKGMEKLKGLKVDKSLRPHPRDLKEIAEETVEALVVIFQESLELGRFLEVWKMANITPLFEKQVRQRTGNYRAVSLSLVIGSTLESFIKDEIAEH